MPDDRQSDYSMLGSDDDDLHALDGILDGDHDRDDAEAGLELDDHQAGEIRRIFMTTLPQYLEPVEQMLDSLIEDGVGEQGMVAALDAALSGIATAAGRIGLDDIEEPVEQLRERLLVLEEGEVPDTTRRALLAELAEIRSVAGIAPAEGEAGETGGLFATLRQRGLDPGTLATLTAAGLVSASQFEVGAHDEVMAVTGLDAEAVDHIYSLLGLQGRSASRAPTGLETLEPDLQRALESQIDAEEHVSRARSEAKQLLRRRDALQAAIHASQQRRDATTAEISRSTARTSELLVALREVRTMRAKLDAERREVERESEAMRARVERLTGEREGLARASKELGEMLAGASRHVGGILEGVERT